MYLQKSLFGVISKISSKLSKMATLSKTQIWRSVEDRHPASTARREACGGPQRNSQEAGWPLRIYVPCGTQLREHTARACALKGSDRDRLLLSKQMSHTVETHSRYYEKVGTSKDAAEAYEISKKVWRKDDQLVSKLSRRGYSYREVESIQNFLLTTSLTRAPIWRHVGSS